MYIPPCMLQFVFSIFSRQNVDCGYRRDLPVKTPCTDPDVGVKYAKEPRNNVVRKEECS